MSSTGSGVPRPNLVLIMADQMAGPALPIDGRPVSAAARW